MNNRSNNLIYIFVIIYFVGKICSCNNINNKLLFNAPITQVKDSILKLNSLMEKIRTDEKGFIKNCFVDFDGNWFISNHLIGKFAIVDIDTVAVLKTLSLSEKASLKSIMIFLKKNYIDGNYRGGIHCYEYSYKSKKNDEYHTRSIIISNDNECNFLFDRYNIIDSSDGLILIMAK